MTPDERQDFERRFRHRQEMYLSAVERLACAGSTWQIYLEHQRINDDGELNSEATTDGTPSPDLKELKRYCKHVTGQGFHLEVVIDIDSNFHVLSWEEIEPDWPEELDPVLFLRWNTIKA